MLCVFHFHVFVLVVFNFALFVFNKKKIEKSEKYKNSVFVYIGTCVPWMVIEAKFSKLGTFVA